LKLYEKQDSEKDNSWNHFYTKQYLKGLIPYRVVFVTPLYRMVLLETPVLGEKVRTSNPVRQIGIDIFQATLELEIAITCSPRRTENLK
jgi:hypothetical protein